MMRFFVSIFALLMMCINSSAQQPEQATIYVQPMLYWCPTPREVNAQVLYLENYVDGILPQSVYITGVTTWAETGAGPMSASHAGNFFAAIDPQRQYIQEANFPAAQLQSPKFLKLISIFETTAAGAQSKSDLAFAPPVRYSIGDAILLAPECYAGDPVPYPYYMLVRILAPTPGEDIKNLPQPTWLMNGVLTTYAMALPPTSIRSIVPASAPSTKFRARLAAAQLGTPGPFAEENVSHMSVCVQSAPGSSTCAAAPIELTFGGQSGFRPTPSMRQWSDWTNIANPTGANFLVTSSMFLPGNTNIWSFSSSGPGVWSATVDSWNSSPLLGTTIFYSNVMSSIDGAQAQ
jgi:hypothetical protein